MRFLIEVDPAWNVKLSQVDGAGRWQRTMQQVDTGRRRLLPALSTATQAAGEVMVSKLHGRDASDIIKLYDRIANRQMQPGEVAAYGGYLFDCLLGSAIWSEMRTVAATQPANHIELALHWDRQDAGMTRLHWEMMFDGGRFLIFGLTDGATKTDVAITRIVPGTLAEARCLGPTPRVLFVIGQPLTDTTIRPGAEIMSLLQHSSLAHSINPAILESASPAMIESKVKSFSPEIVHFICHGMIDPATSEGKLILQPDPGNPTKHFGAQQIAQWLGPTPPAIVVISACNSAVAAGATLGPQVVSPLAAQLVAHGIPVVIGMSGQVSDLACRLFTRCFGEALISGETLVAATAKGRRAAFARGRAPADSPDWAFPTVYMSEKVAPDYAPACKRSGLSVDERLRPYALPVAPVFCGRQDFMEVYRDLLQDGGINVLVAIAPDKKTKGYGRTRLLQQLTLRAVIDGHVPCPVLCDGTNWRIPKDELELAGLIDEAGNIARRSLGLPTGEETPVTWLQMYRNGHVALKELPTRIARELRRTTVNKEGADREVTPSAVRVALEMQFAELMDAARKRYPGLITSTGRAIVLLDDAEDYVHLLFNIAKEDTLATCGLGGDERVPVIMALSAGTPALDRLGTNSQRPGWKLMELRPFNKSADRREDMIAYARVLMNPFDPNILKDVSGKAWFMDYGAPTEAISEVETRYSDWLKGLPIEFVEKSFYLIATIARDKAFVVEADDDKALKALVQ
jgi:CHAT domain